ncbi:prepilin peptidase [Microbacterium album]|nr:A24 family peptidase [Microbacterium album]
MGAGEAIVATAHAAFLVVGLVLIRVDILEHRLPDRIVLPSAIGLTALLAVAAAMAGDLQPAGRAALGGLTLMGLYLALRAAHPAGLGGGDVKLAALVGVFLGWHGWMPLVVGAGAAFVLGAAFATVMMLAGRAGRDTHIAFGPWMIVGAWAALLVT